MELPHFQRNPAEVQAISNGDGNLRGQRRLSRITFCLAAVRVGANVVDGRPTESARTTFCLALLTALRTIVMGDPYSGDPA